ncbi:MAG: spore coat protein CotJB [Lachnospiraceae bacterium]|nr:spore coat protein CotJB [Lachnospiraceae bacterium]
MKPCQTSESNRMLKDIGIVNFVMVELGLYLDTHPYDQEAMEYFQHYRRMYNRMVSDFSERFYPLNMCNANDTEKWTWTLAPMPWEGGF